MSPTDTELLESFCEVEPIGTDYAESIARWAQDNLSEDELEEFSSITPDMSGESAASCFTELGISDESIVQMLRDVGYSMDVDSDDSFDMSFDVKRPPLVSERLNEFLAECVNFSKQSPDLVKEVEVKGKEDGGREEVRVVLFAPEDLRYLSFSSPLKLSFMEYLHGLRSIAQRYSMLDEAFFFDKKKSEFVIALKHYGVADL